MKSSFTEIQAKSLLRVSKKIDSWFLSRFHLNLYRGCAHNCVYCDGRAEKYAVEGEFGRDVAVKTNALELLARELEGKRRRKPLPGGFVCFGGGVGDAWQPAEEKYRLARGALEIVAGQGRPAHVLTKSALVERDFDLLEKINRSSRALLSASFSSVDQEASALLEPGVPAPAERLRVLSEAKKRGIPCGMFLMPVVPFLTDTQEAIRASVRSAAESGLDYVVFAGMTLKPGRQTDYFLSAIAGRDPGLPDKFRQLYAGSRWKLPSVAAGIAARDAQAGVYGQAPAAYYSLVSRRFFEACRELKMAVRIPARLFRDVVERDDFIVCLLEHVDYMLSLRGKKSGLGYAAYQLSRLGRPIAELGEASIPGVNAMARSIVKEIVETGESVLYDRLLSFEE